MIDKDKKNLVFVISVLSIVIFSCYSNTFYASWQFDDAIIFKNKNFRIRDFSLSEVKKTFHCHPQESNVIYRPVSCLSLAINLYLGGRDVFGYHVVNISIHLVAAVFLFLLIQITLNNPIFSSNYRKEAYHIALLTSVLWALSPIQTQAVTYIVQRMTSLAAMFYVISIYFYIRGRISNDSKRYLFFIISLITGLFSIGSKENSVVLPFMIILYEFIFFQKADVKWLSKNIILIILALIFPLMVFILLWGQNPIAIIYGYGFRDFSLTERLLTQSRVIVYYLSLLIYPSIDRLNLDHDFSISHSLITPPTTMVSIFFILFLITLGLKLIKKRPLFSFSIFWFLGNLIIESSIIPLEIIFEHRLYLPSMFFYFILAFIIHHYAIQRELIKRPYAIGLLLILIFLQGMGTYIRNFVWHDEITLWSDCVTKSPKKARTHHNLGFAFQKRGMLSEAMAQYRKAIAINPRFEAAYNNLGQLYEKKGMLDKAIAVFNEAISIGPDCASYYYSLGNIYHKKGMAHEAVAAYRKAIEINPYFLEAHNKIRVMHAERGMLR